MPCFIFLPQYPPEVLPPHDTSLIALNGFPVQATVIFFSTAGGISFLFYLHCFPGWCLWQWAYNPLDSLFDVVSTISTAGLSAGITGPDLHPLLKIILSADVLLGRLEIMVWLVMLTPQTWIGGRIEE